MLDRWERDARNYIIFSTEEIIGEVEPEEYNDNDNNDEDY
jgi:hypothetical protein